MDPKKFYATLWESKRDPEFRAPGVRDWFHRLVLDPVFDPWANPRNQVALKLLRGGGRLLDVGCWNGYFLERVREAELYRELHGVDMVEEGVAAARAKGLRAEQVDLNRDTLPFPDAYFDAVTLLAVLEHLFDPYAVIREIHRVVRPGGDFIIDVPNVASFTNRLRILFGGLPVTSADPGWDGGHLHYFSKASLDRFLASEGFEVVERKTSGGRAQLREWWLSLLGGELIYLCQRR